MGKLIVCVCAALFVCGIVSAKCGDTHQAAMGNAHGITWLLVIGVCVLFGCYKLVGSK